MDAWSSVGRDAWRRFFEGWFASDSDGRIVVDFGDSRVLGEGAFRASHATASFAVVSGTGEVLRSLQNRMTWMARSIGGRWRILHQHTSVPITTAALTGVLNQAAVA